ncbi:MAG: NAD(P)/FAD-dependent oxidoreductase [Planctomycetota bacterium]
MTQPHVVIIGGGFAGLEAAQNIAKAHRDARITVLDRRNHHLFQPLLYQVATAGLSPADISMPIRTALRRHPNVEVRLCEVTDADLKARRLETSLGPIDYDFIIFAAGATHSYFGNDQWEEFAPGLKTLEQATEIRRRVLRAFELAEFETDPGKLEELLTFVVVGAGPTGVELAGAIGEISRFTLTRDFRRIDPSKTKILLIEAGPRVLASFAEELSLEAAHDLEKLGVAVRTDTLVTDIDAEGVMLGDERISAGTVVWAAGVRASALGRAIARTSSAQLDDQGRVRVEPDLSIPGHPEAFVLGDQAYVEQEDGAPVPGQAPGAIQMGRHVAKVINAARMGSQRPPFRYFDKGQMATIGRAAAVAETQGWKLHGFVAWLVWCFVHILYLIGFRNRLLVFAQWLWSYVTYRRGARLITETDWRQERPDSETDEEAESPDQEAPNAKPTPKASGANGKDESKAAPREGAAAE